MGTYINYSNRVEFTSKKWNTSMIQYSFAELNEQIISAVIKNHRISIIQINETIPENKLNLLYNLFQARPDLTFRIYHFLEDNCCDLSFLTKLKSIQKLSIEYIKNVTHIEVLKQLPLTYLRLYVFDLKDYSILKELSIKLEELSLYHEWKGKTNFDAEWLIRYKKLKILYIGKLSKGIENIQYIKSLDTLTLRGIKLDNLAFLKESNIVNLSIHYTSMNDLSSLENNFKIKSLELWRILKLENLSFISKMTNLTQVKLLDQSNVKVFPNIQKCNGLKKVYLDNLKTLENIQEISDSTSIEELTIIGCQKLKIEDYIPVFENPNIKVMNIRGAGNSKKMKAIDELMIHYHKCSI